MRKDPFLKFMVLCCAVFALQAIAEPPTIPSVKSLDELRKVTPVRLSDGQEIRIGITDAAEGAPWRLIWCMPVDPKADFENPDGDPEEWLGPVRVRVVDEHRLEEITGAVTMRPQQADAEVFYCTAIATATRGSFNIEVVERPAAKGEVAPVLMRTPFVVKDAPPCYWHIFADMSAGDSYVVSTRPFAARPRYSGMALDAWPPDAKGDALLDGLNHTAPLELSFDQSVADPKLIIKSAADMINSPSEHLLARWWIGDKPVIAAPPTAKNIERQMQHGWRISMTREMNLPLVLPSTLGPLKPGDHVKLQLMYCPGGTKPCGEIKPQKMQMLFVPRILAHQATLPRLSDVLEITVRADMLPK